MRLALLIALLASTLGACANPAANRDLLDAAAAGDSSGIKAALKAGASIDAVDPEEGQTPLIAAVKGNHINAVVTLVISGADLNIQDENGYPPLHYAVLGEEDTAAGTNVYRSWPDMVQALVGNGADYNFIDHRGMTPLYYAASRGHVDIVALLLQVGAEPNPPVAAELLPLAVAAQQGNLVLAQLLLEAGADPAQAGCAYLPLLIACERGDQDAVAALINAGADVNLADSLHSRETPLHRAAYHGYAQVTRQLLAAGANPNATSADGTPLHYAAAHGHTDALAALLEAGADVNAPDFLKRTPLHQAAANGQLAAAQALLAAGADVARADESWGWTPLHDAAHYGQIEIVRLLLDAGADPLATDKYGNTPRALAGPMKEIRAMQRPASCNDVIELLKVRGG